MIFEKGKPYRLTELDGALVISEAHDKVKNPSAQPLVIGDAGTLLTYLDRYFFEREHGQDLPHAHEQACKTAALTETISTKLDAVTTLFPKAQILFKKKIDL